ncbi:MAG: glycerol-3-phosphate 1-O-acyltransferase PlsY [Planctomycetes bacterium]|nr:glycerol-3-phosphate 1-O-acyltransferase PlsY [Planctomycetota bacterium]
MPSTEFLLAILASYLSGSIPVGFLAGKAKGIDLRKTGSGNIGATNVVRTLGKRIGITCFVVDVLKGFLPTFLLGPWLVEHGATELGLDAVRLALGVAAIAGHVVPVWLRFKGGKGVATSAGVCAALAWQAVLIAFVLWYVLLKLTRYVSVASMLASLAFPAVFVGFEGFDAAFGERRVVTVLAIGLALAIVVLHRANIRRLMRGEEPRVGQSKSQGA